MICPYCGKKAKWCENKEKYGRNFGKSYMCYFCRDCDAYVGCHNNTRKSLGTMANAELRSWRIKAHEIIDRQWKTGLMTRRSMYAMLKRELGTTIHIGESNIAMCKQVISLFSKEPIK